MGRRAHAGGRCAGLDPALGHRSLRRAARPGQRGGGADYRAHCRHEVDTVEVVNVDEIEPTTPTSRTYLVLLACSQAERPAEMTAAL
ncbi:MAG TPA: hypothetical protein VK988_06055 [Acidimicrobiales bacterium]|nr:hypothetical protein [Acidimicrobiales bacterium]